ncbi:MAG: SAM-dependent methyltransferase, partial [Deltaproteobacteria bacterium]|nr:SAM-dependent methyltransferase [Deltaproteobacteria bacterium]
MNISRPLKRPPPITASPRHAVLLVCASSSVLAYEIILMRLLSIGQWHHFAYMVISIALLGLGASGSLLFLLFDRIKKHPDHWLIILAGATALSFPLSFSLSQKVGLDPLQLIWQPGEWLRMLLTYLLMALPFLLAGGIIGIILTGAARQAHRMYAADLLGAGLGALAVVPALYLGPPWGLLPALGGLLIFGTLFFCIHSGPKTFGILTVVISSIIVLLVYDHLPPIPKMHHTKALPVTLNLPEARVEAVKTGPLGMINVVGSSLIRHAPGLSLNFGLDLASQDAELPEQKALFTDADALSPIARFHGNPDELAYLDYTTMALPYHVRPPSRVLVVGAGGGSDVLLAMRHRTPNVTAIEANKQVADLLKGPFAEFSGDLYSHPNMTLQVREARQFIHATRDRFDLIQLSLIDAFGASASGVYSASESYLYTTEAFALYLSRLSENGTLAVTRWLKLPPRDSFRIIATALSALRRLNIRDRPERHLLFIRSWKTCTILISKSPFTQEELARATAFCDKRSFDVGYHAGMDRLRANRYDVQPSPYYYIGASRLSGPEADAFTKKYIFDISPTTDDRPYFSLFFRWDKAKELLLQLHREWLPMVELGFVFILATLLQAFIAGGLLIFLPLLGLRWIRRRAGPISGSHQGSGIIGTLSYFSCIGLGFMFLEMALLSKYTLVLSYPVYSAATVLSSILVFAGLGSLCVRRAQSHQRGFLWIVVGVIICWVAIQTVAGKQISDMAMGWSLGGRIALTVSIIAVLSFFLGWPFPSGLRNLS